jgi:serine/threonine protein kinase
MGEVYRARDTRLNREVAIKVSDEQFSQRFEREARAVAALNHTNICTLYDVGPNYLVMDHRPFRFLRQKVLKLLRDADGGGRFEKREVFLKGLNQPSDRLYRVR